jgi:hypothetical protein
MYVQLHSNTTKLSRARYLVENSITKILLWKFIHVNKIFMLFYLFMLIVELIFGFKIARRSKLRSNMTSGKEVASLS